MTPVPESRPSIVVIGSVNIDHVVVADVFPRPGQTVTGREVRTTLGGKGANQAVAAAGVGADVVLVARVGDDDEGVHARRVLADRGVDVAAVTAVTQVSTGTAWITVAEQDNTIVVVAGANGRWPPDGDPLRGAGRDAAVVLAQLEIPRPVVERAAAGCRGRFVLNAAPAADLPDGLLQACEVLVLNEHELAVVARAPEQGADLQSAHRALRRRGAGRRHHPGRRRCVRHGRGRHLHPRSGAARDCGRHHGSR